MEYIIGREDQKENDLFFVCSLIEYISRATKNRSVDVADALGRKRIGKIYNLADVYHSDRIEKVCEDFAEEAGISEGYSVHIFGREKRWRIDLSRSADIANGIYDTSDRCVFFCGNIIGGGKGECIAVR